MALSRLRRLRKERRGDQAFVFDISVQRAVHCAIDADLSGDCEARYVLVFLRKTKEKIRTGEATPGDGGALHFDDVLQFQTSLKPKKSAGAWNKKTFGISLKRLLGGSEEILAHVDLDLADYADVARVQVALPLTPTSKKLVVHSEPPTVHMTVTSRQQQHPVARAPPLPSQEGAVDDLDSTTVALSGAPKQRRTISGFFGTIARRTSTSTSARKSVADASLFAPQQPQAPHEKQHEKQQQHDKQQQGGETPGRVSSASSTSANAGAVSSSESSDSGGHSPLPPLERPKTPAPSVPDTDNNSVTDTMGDGAADDTDRSESGATGLVAPTTPASGASRRMSTQCDAPAESMLAAAASQRARKGLSKKFWRVGKKADMQLELQRADAADWDVQWRDHDLVREEARRRQALSDACARLHSGLLLSERMRSYVQQLEHLRQQFAESVDQVTREHVATLMEHRVKHGGRPERLAHGFDEAVQTLRELGHLSLSGLSAVSQEEEEAEDTDEEDRHLLASEEALSLKEGYERVLRPLSDVIDVAREGLRESEERLRVEQGLTDDSIDRLAQKRSKTVTQQSRLDQARLRCDVLPREPLLVDFAPCSRCQKSYCAGQCDPKLRAKLDTYGEGIPGMLDLLHAELAGSQPSAKSLAQTAAQKDKTLAAQRDYQAQILESNERLTTLVRDVYPAITMRVEQLETRRLRTVQQQMRQLRALEKRLARSQMRVVRQLSRAVGRLEEVRVSTETFASAEAVNHMCRVPVWDYDMTVHPTQLADWARVYNQWQREEANRQREDNAAAAAASVLQQQQQHDSDVEGDEATLAARAGAAAAMACFSGQPRATPTHSKRCHRYVKELQLDEFVKKLDNFLTRGSPLREGFELFLAKSFCSENLQFYDAVTEFLSRSRQQQSLPDALALIERFVRPNTAELEVNLPSHMITDLVREADASNLEGLLELLPRARTEIRDLMNTDSFKSFRQSTTYKRALQRMVLKRRFGMQYYRGRYTPDIDALLPLDGDKSAPVDAYFTIVPAPGYSYTSRHRDRSDS